MSIIDRLSRCSADESLLGYAWHRVTIALVEMFSVVVPPPPPPPHHQEFDGSDNRVRQPHRQWQAASAVLTAILVAVVIALSCGICTVVAVLYRRQYYNRRRTDRGHVQYGLGCNDAADADAHADVDVDADVDADAVAGDGAGKIMVAGQQQRKAAGAQSQQQPPASRPCRPTTSNNNNSDFDGDVDRTGSQSAAQVSRTHQRLRCADQVRKCRTPSAVHRLQVAGDRDDGAGPDIVMSTATTAALVNAAGA